MVIGGTTQWWDPVTTWSAHRRRRFLCATLPLVPDKPDIHIEHLIQNRNHIQTETSNIIPSGLCRLVMLLRSTTLKRSSRPISNHQLNTLLHLHLGPIYLVVFKGSYACAWISHLEGGFTLRCLQRLSLPDTATQLWDWFPTDAPVVRPPRSSRTKGSSSQISYAHAG